MTAKSTLFNKLECLIGISITEKDRISHVKNKDNFLRVWDRQSADDTSRALFSSMSEWQCIHFLKRKRNFY